MNVKLIVPNRDAADMTFRYGKEIADIAGGFTATQGTGGWVDDQGHLIVEPVTVFDCYVEAVSDLYAQDIGNRYRSLAKRIAQELHQTRVYLSIDGVVEFVKP